MLATYEHSTATEYAHGYQDGAEEVRWLISDQRASLIPNALAELRADADYSRDHAGIYTRAYALGMLRGMRHAAREERI